MYFYWLHMFLFPLYNSCPVPLEILKLRYAHFHMARNSRNSRTLALQGYLNITVKEFMQSHTQICICTKLKCTYIYIQLVFQALPPQQENYNLAGKIIRLTTYPGILIKLAVTHTLANFQNAVISYLGSMCKIKSHAMKVVQNTILKRPQPERLPTSL